MEWHLRQIGVPLLMTLLTAGCSVTGHRTGAGDAMSLDGSVSTSAQKVTTVARGPGASRVVCTYRSLDLATSALVESAAAPPSNTDAKLLVEGLYDLCTAYRSGEISRTQYAVALREYAPLVVQLSAYRALIPQVSELQGSADVQYVDSLIAGSPAVFALCRSTSFQTRLAVFGNAIAVRSFAKWCNAKALDARQAVPDPMKDAGDR